MSTLKSFLSVLLISQTIYARSYNPCELENELSTIHKLSSDESRNLTCIAQKYSQLTTNIINNGSKATYYGIFQIGNKWCDLNKAGGKCNIKCEDLVDDDITDDIKCAQKIFQKLGNKAWKLNKESACKKEFNYLDEYCHKNANIDDTFQVQPDFCELARKLMALYDISKIDATVWSCISEYSKTGNLNLRDDEDTCVKARDVECAIKHNKKTGISGFTSWPAYDEYCKNITESTCFKVTESVNTSEIIEQINNVQHKTSIKPTIYTTSTEVSVLIEDEEGHLTQYNGNDITSDSPKVSQETTEFLSDSLVKPSYDEKPTIEGYSKVRIMSADKKIVELPGILVSTPKTLDEITLINSSLAKSTTDTISVELSHSEHTTQKIEVKYYETIDKCALAKDMNDSGRIPQNLISTFVCIAEHESGLNVSFIQSDGQQSRYGLFQIDNQIYCGINGNNNQCNVLCTQLVDDQFDNDFECIRHLYKKEGLNYWPSYERSCKNINSNSLDYCFEQSTTSQRPSINLNRGDEYHSTESTLVATHNDVTLMEMTTLINDVESTPGDGSLDFCEFSHQLKVNMSVEVWEDLVHYVCIADQISHLRPKFLNDDKYGIFSLKESTCGKNEAGGLCSILCSSLLNDDLIDDARCMIKVYNEYGLKAWNIDNDRCKVYTPKILRCIDEGKFFLPNDEESDGVEDVSTSTNIKENEVEKQNQLEMTLPRANIGIETVDKLEDSKILDETTLPSIDTTAITDDTAIEETTQFEIHAKSSSEKTIDLENEEQTTTDFIKNFETTEQSFEEDENPKLTIKSLSDINTINELDQESLTTDSYENDQTTTLIYDDNESNKKEEEAIVDINLLTTSTENALDTKTTAYLESINEDFPETTEEVIQEFNNNLPINDKMKTTHILETTTVSISVFNESKLENNLEDDEEEMGITFKTKTLEQNDDAIEFTTKINEIALEMDTSLEMNNATEAEMEETTISLDKIEVTTMETDRMTMIHNAEIEYEKNIEKESVETTTENQNNNLENFENHYSGRQDINNINLEDDNSNIKDYPTPENQKTTIEIKDSQTTESYDVLEDITIPEIVEIFNFPGNDQELNHEVVTSEIPQNFDDITDSFDSEILKSDNFLQNTEKSSEEDTTTNILNINPESTESTIIQNDKITENAEKITIQETTTTKKEQTTEELYLKSTTESFFPKNVIATKEDKIENTSVSLDDKSDIIVTTERILPKLTTESVYYTSIREIIEEYQKSNVKNFDNAQTKRNQKLHGEDTTLDDIFDDYDSYSGSTKMLLDSLDQLTTLPISPIRNPQIKSINKCELARYMNVSGFPENLLPTLLCIAEHESALNPFAIKISEAFNKFGLFQIDDATYCSTDENINECEVQCALLIDNQYDNDFECVRHIYKKEGFNYWPSYEKSCKNVSPYALDYCSEDIMISKTSELESTTKEYSHNEDLPVETNPDFRQNNHKELSHDNKSTLIIRKFELCELARELHSRNISIDDIPQYLCIADIKSDLNIKIPNENEQSYGLFNINSEFCGQTESGGICSTKCSELWDSNISDDVDCVYKIIETNSTDKWNLSSKACQIYNNKVLECFDIVTEMPKISEIDFDDVITESDKMTDMISGMTDKNQEDLEMEITNLRSSNSDIESDETTEKTIEETTSKLLQILTSSVPTSTDNGDVQARRIPIVNINLPRDLLTDQNLSKQVNTLIKNFTYYDVLPQNGSIIFNIFNFNIYGEDHDIKFTINPGTQLKEKSDDD